MSISELYRNIVEGLKNLWDYRVLIWQDRDWDYSYILLMLEFKLKRMEKMWGVHTHYEGDLADKLIISDLLADLKLLIDDDWCQEEHNAHESQYGKLYFFKNENGTSTLKRTNTDPGLEQSEREAWLILNAKEIIAKNKVKDRFFKNLKDNYEKLWD